MTPVERLSRVRASYFSCNDLCPDIEPPTDLEEIFETTGFGLFDETASIGNPNAADIIATQHSSFTSDLVNIQTFAEVDGFTIPDFRLRDSDSFTSLIFNLEEPAAFQFAGMFSEIDFIESFLGTDGGGSMASLTGPGTNLMFASSFQDGEIVFDGSQIVGTAETTVFDVSGFLEPSTYVLEVLSESHGDIDPSAFTSANVTLSFITVPEPAHLTVLLSAVTLFMLRRGRKRI